MAEEIKREIWLLQRRRIPPIDIAEGSQIPIALTLMDYTVPTGATAKAYARPWDRETTYQQDAAVEGNTVRFTPPDGFFRAGGNALQIEINGNKIPLLLDVNCGPRLSNGGDGATPEAVRPLVERAEEAAKAAAGQAAEAKASADAAKKSAQGIRDSAEKIDRNAEDINQLRDDLAKVNDNKISKFYANNFGEMALSDSDNGYIQDMILYGKSVQDGNPTPDAPVEIQSVVNPKVTVCGKNMLDIQNPDGIRSSVIDSQCTKSNNAMLLVGGKQSHTWNAQREGWLLPKGTYTFSVKMETDDSTYTPLLAIYTSDSLNESPTVIASLTQAACKKTFTFDKTKYLYLYAHLTTDAGITTEQRTVRYYDIQLEAGTESTPFEPYKGHTATLRYALNAIPVTSGGNVTMNGQQYIADFVDIKNKKLVRCTRQKNFAKITSSNIVEMGEFLRFDINNIGDIALTPLRLDSTTVLCKQLESEYNNTVGDHEYCRNSAPGTFFGLVNYISKGRFQSFDLAGVNEYLKNHPLTYLIAIEPEETDLTDEEVQLFKDLAAYYPITNVTVTSEQTGGYTTFDYPISLANGWNYVKQQLGDTRDYIYDMELQAMEAYVNSEYAVALAELEG